MKCELLFYLANKTGASQDALSRALDRIDCTLGAVSFSTGASELGYALADAVAHTNVIFIVGGLDRTDALQVLQVLSKALSLPMQADGLQGAKGIPNAAGTDGCIIESGKQSIIVLPDFPAQLADMLRATVTPYLCRKYGLSIHHRFAPPELEIPCLQEQEIPPVRTDFHPAPKQKRRVKTRVVLSALLLLALLAAAGFYMYSRFYN